MSRLTTRVLLGLSLILAIGVGWLSFGSIDGVDPSPWATLAAALAVVTAVISAWGAQRVVELEEDKQRPYAFPYFDTTSRYGLILFRVANSGGSAAHNIKMKWEEPLLDSKSNEVRFSPTRDDMQIPILFPGQSLARIVDGHVQFFGMDRRHEYRGTISFEDSRGRTFSQPFVMDAEMYRETPSYEREDIKTHFELQKIPSAVQKVENELKRIRSALEALQDHGGES